MPCVLHFYKDGDETDSCANGDSENYSFFSEITGFFSEILQVHEIGVNRSVACIASRQQANCVSGMDLLGQF